MSAFATHAFMIAFLAAVMSGGVILLTFVLGVPLYEYE